MTTDIFIAGLAGVTLIAVIVAVLSAPYDGGKKQKPLIDRRLQKDHHS